MIPHPSGINRWYNGKQNRRKAEKFLRETFAEKKAMVKETGYTVNELTRIAAEHDANLVLAVSKFSQSIVDVGIELAVMHGEKLWSYVKDPQTNGDNRGCFRTWRAYARYRLGKMSDAKIYEYLSASTLTHGKKPLSTKHVEQLGVKRSAQLARLPEKQRTKKLVKEFRELSVAEVKQTVDVMLDDEVPQSERKAKLIPYTIALPKEVIELIAEVERSGQFLESVRDNDRSWTLRAKLWHQVWWHFLDAHREELKAAEQYKKEFLAQKNANSPQVASQSVN